MLIYTAGTTGPSKGCMISHNYVCNLGRQVVLTEDRHQDDCNWTALPLFHMNATGGSILSCMFVGCACGHLPAFLGVALLARHPAQRRHGGEPAGLHDHLSRRSRRHRGLARLLRATAHGARLAVSGASAGKMEDTRFGVRRAGSNSYGLTEAARVTGFTARRRCPARILRPPQCRLRCPHLRRRRQ